MPPYRLVVPRSSRAILIILCALALWPAGARSAPARAQPPGSPGMAPVWAIGRKDGVGSAYGTASTVWYTLAAGKLTEVFYPTTDTPDVTSLSFVVTDGHTFADQFDRPSDYAVSHPDPQSESYTVTYYDQHGRFRLLADYLSDPARPTVVIHVRLLLATRDVPAPYMLYVRYDPALNGNGTNDTGSVAGAALLAHDDKGHYGPVASALLANPPLLRGTTGFAGTASDPATAFAAHFNPGTSYAAAGPGNIVQGAQVGLNTAGSAELALGFGSSQSAAQRTATATLARPYAALAQAFAAGWHHYAATLLQPSGRFGSAERDEFFSAALALKASEDKRYPGAFVASLSTPWGQSVPANQDSGQGYHRVWARDLYEIASGLAAAGDRATARDAVRYMLHTLEGADGSMPQNSLVDGTPVQSARQMDEVAYPLILAWSLGLTDRATYTHSLRPLADYLVRHGPSSDQERWEEDPGYSPSTIAAEIAGLVAAGAMAARDGDPARALAYRAVADSWQRSVKQWTVTTTGPLAHHPYFIRLDDNTNPNDGAPISIAGGNNVDERRVVDAGFLELVRLGELAPADPDVVRSLAVVDTTIAVQTPFGVGWHRYNFDSYGDQANGTPWSNNTPGVGHVWPVFDGERGEYALSRNQEYQSAVYLQIMSRFASPTGLIPEQVWEGRPISASPAGTSPLKASIGMQPGQAAGSANPLNWSLGQYIRLLADLQGGTLLDQPAVTRDRYLIHPVGLARLTVTSPAGEVSSARGRITLTGKAAPRSRVVILVTGSTGGTSYPAVVAQDGSFSARINVPSDFVVKLSVAAQDHAGNTALVLRRVE